MPVPSPVRRLALTVAFVICAVSSSSAPAAPPSLQGGWTLSRRIEATLMTCALTDARLWIEQETSTFFGQSHGGVTKCGLFPATRLGPNVVHEGKLDGPKVSFRLGRDARFTGTIDGDRITGTATITVDGKIREGTFEMVRVRR